MPRVRKLPPDTPPKTLESIKDFPINRLPVTAKVATARALKELQLGHDKISELMGVTQSSVWRYLNEYEVPDIKEWNDFSRAVKKLFEYKENEVKAKALSKLNEQIDQAKFYELTGLYKVLSDARREDQKATTNIQQAVVFQVSKDTK